MVSEPSNVSELFHRLRSALALSPLNSLILSYKRRGVARESQSSSSNGVLFGFHTVGQCDLYEAL